MAVKQRQTSNQCRQFNNPHENFQHVHAHKMENRLTWRGNRCIFRVLALPPSSSARPHWTGWAKYLHGTLPELALPRII